MATHLALTPNNAANKPGMLTNADARPNYGTLYCRVISNDTIVSYRRRKDSNFLSNLHSSTQQSVGVNLGIA